jgi:hypothetical protein
MGRGYHQGILITRRAVSATLIALTLGAPWTAVAEATDRAAKTLLREAFALLEVGRVADACVVFEASQKLEPATSTLMNLASCRERNGQIATAWRLFQEVEHETSNASDGVAKKLHEVARDRTKRVESRLSRLTIRVPTERQIERLEVWRGTDVVEPAMWNRALPVDGGTYRITARIPGATPWASEVTIGEEADDKTVEIPNLRKLDTADLRQTSSRTTLGLPLAVAGGGALLLVGAVGFGAWGSSIYDAARDERTDQTRRDMLYRDANAKRHIAIGTGVGGIVCVGVATWLYLQRHASADSSKVALVRVQVVPMVGADTGLAVRGSFE